MSSAIAARAHALQRKAEDFEECGNWSEAADTYKQAADAFDGLISKCNDYVVATTLQEMRNKYLRKSKTCFYNAKTLSDKMRDEKLSKEQQLQQQQQQQQQSLAASQDTKESGDGEEGLSKSQNVDSSSSINSANNSDQAFEQFWNYVNEWVSNPVAFTSAPLDSNAFSGPGGFNKNSQFDAKSALESFYIVPLSGNLDQSRMGTLGPLIPSIPASPLPALRESGLLDQDMAMSPNLDVKETETQNNNTNLEDENKRLKELVNSLASRVNYLEKAAQESNVLRSSILNLQEEFSKHAGLSPAHRNMSTQWPISRTPSSMGRPGGTTEREKRLEDQIYGLQEQNERLMAENKRQDELLVKYKERWDRLKETARQKKIQQQQQHHREQQQELDPKDLVAIPESLG
ncbi:hypothetical protein H4219_004893 [Mycoemilia scoparia]|uniref:MIT domain-containing protein n=1 Tax=Mycoemilia scoparia TaxID=417184 RepID=A0A9W7ZR28_9FUNG|nr:hypothetical protein H4219_004893 [Mycoemilia scoparia]